MDDGFLGGDEEAVGDPLTGKLRFYAGYFVNP